MMWDPPRPDDEAFCARVEGEVLQARLRAYESLGVKPPRPVPVVPVVVPVAAVAPRMWTRSRVIAAVWRHEIEFGCPVRSTDWIRRRGGEWPTTSDVVREFGSWTAGMVAAGYPASVEERLGY